MHDPRTIPALCTTTRAVLAGALLASGCYVGLDDADDAVAAALDADEVAAERTVRASDEARTQLGVDIWTIAEIDGRIEMTADSTRFEDGIDLTIVASDGGTAFELRSPYAARFDTARVEDPEHLAAVPLEAFEVLEIAWADVEPSRAQQCLEFDGCDEDGNGGDPACSIALGQLATCVTVQVWQCRPSCVPNPFWLGTCSACLAIHGAVCMPLLSNAFAKCTGPSNNGRRIDCHERYGLGHCDDHGTGNGGSACYDVYCDHAYSGECCGTELAATACATGLCGY